MNQANQLWGKSDIWFEKKYYLKIKRYSDYIKTIENVKLI